MRNPISAIERSIKLATEQGDPNAELLFLATSGADSQPGIRTLLLRDIADRSFLILFSKFHQKWQHLQETGNFEVLLWYPLIGHQYRLQGSVRILPYEEVNLNWKKTPDFAKAVDLSYGEGAKPGDPIDSAEVFRSRVRACDRDISNSSAPPHFTGAWLEANFIEFLGASQDRLHDRTQFRWDNGSWSDREVIP